jgi:anti-sigma-K factor RskA
MARDRQFRSTYDARQIRRGTATVNTTAARSGNTTVTFSPAFATTPTVVATAQDSSYVTAVFGISATQVQIFVNHVDGTALTNAVSVQWFAIAG